MTDRGSRPWLSGYADWSMGCGSTPSCTGGRLVGRHPATHPRVRHLPRRRVTVVLDSEACRIEREYAASVHRTILPVALSAVPPALPSDIATLQIVDFSQPGEQSLSDLARALLAAPDAEPLPDPLPPDPDAPLSYLTDLVDLVSSSRELTKSEQMEILFRLERGLESSDHDEREGARQVLHRMRNRDDLAASVEKTIDLLAREQVPSVPAAPPDEHKEPSQAPTPPRRPPTAPAAASPAPAASTPPPAARARRLNTSTQPSPGTRPGRASSKRVPRHRAAVIVAVAVVLVAAAAGLGSALLGGGDDDTSTGPSGTDDHAAYDDPAQDG